MMETDTAAVFAARLADIELPPVPTWTEVWLPWLLAAFVGSIVAIFAWQLWRRRQQRSTTPAAQLARLTQIHAAWAADQLDDRAAAYWLGALARQHVTTTPMPTELLQRLDAARYRPDGSRLDAALFEGFRAWLARPC